MGTALEAGRAEPRQGLWGQQRGWEDLSGAWMGSLWGKGGRTHQQGLVHPIHHIFPHLCSPKKSFPVLHCKPQDDLVDKFQCWRTDLRSLKPHPFYGWLEKTPPFLPLSEHFWRGWGVAGAGSQQDSISALHISLSHYPSI